MKNKTIISITILLVTGLIILWGGVWYYSRERIKLASDNRIFTTEDILQTQSTSSLFMDNDPAISSWKTYSSTKYNISFKYPAENSVQVNKDDSITISFPNCGENEFSCHEIYMAPFDTKFSIAAASEKLHYDRNTNRWIHDGNPSCERTLPLGIQSIPSYFVGDGRANPGRPEVYAIILQGGLLIFSGTNDYPETKFSDILETVMFDNPEIIKQATCN
ncbi:MAG: hypothetical protein Q7S11_02040 [bacterium]|nr:hypothetical protein [bacterium]